MTVTTALRGLAVVFVAALLQAVVVSSTFVFGSAPDLLLVVVVALGLVRGSVAGAVLGFVGGFVVDLVTLDTLGVTSLVLTLAGFWAGRYAETTGRGRALAPVLSVGVITVLAAIFALVLHYMLGEAVSAHQALITTLLPELLLNLLLAYPVFRLVRRLVGERVVLEPSREVELVV
jgi:rod shape-determining protein MreD